MNNSTLIQLFKSLDKADRRQLRKVVASPYFNQREDVTALFEYIDKYIDNGASKLLKEKAFVAIYNKQKFDVDRLYHIMSMLNQIILKYLTVNELEKNTPQYNRLLNQSLRQRGVEKMYDKTLADAKAYLEQQPLRNARYHHDNFLVRYEQLDSQQQLHSTATLELQEMTTDFHVYCISEILRLAYTILSHQTVTKKEYKQPLLESVLLVAEQHLNIPAIATHYYAFQTLRISKKIALTENTNNNIEHIIENEGTSFKKLKKEIIDNQNLFPEAELRDLLLVAINYCIRRQNQGELMYVRETLDLYLIGLESRVLMENETISIYNYKNIMTLALKIEDYNWAERFLNDYKKFLPEKERENIYRYNYAIFNFRKKDYNKAIQLLQEVNLKEVLFNLDARRMLARIYYDLNEFTALDSYIESSKIYLHRQKELGYQKEAYTNFFRTIEKLLKTDLKSAIQKEQLKQEITDTQLLAERDWLLSKLA